MTDLAIFIRDNDKNDITGGEHSVDVGQILHHFGNFAWAGSFTRQVAAWLFSSTAGVSIDRPLMCSVIIQEE